MRFGAAPRRTALSRTLLLVSLCVLTTSFADSQSSKGDGKIIVYQCHSPGHKSHGKTFCCDFETLTGAETAGALTRCKKACPRLRGRCYSWRIDGGQDEQCFIAYEQCVDEANEEFEEAMSDCLSIVRDGPLVDCAAWHIMGCYQRMQETGSRVVTSTEIRACLNEACEVVYGSGAATRYGKLNDSSFPGKEDVLSCLDTVVRAFDPEKNLCLRTFMECS